MNPQALEIVSGRNLTDAVVHTSWGWEVAVYLFLGGMVAGLLVLRSALDLQAGRTPRSLSLQLSPLIAVALLSVGMGALFLDLGYKLHVYRFYLALRPSSPMSWGSWILLIAVPAALLQGLASLPRERVPFPVPAMDAMLLARVTLITGLALGIYTGLLLGTLPAHPLWNSALLGPLFLVSGVSTGAAFLMLARLAEEERAFIVRADVAALCVEMSLLFLMALGLAGGGEPGRQTLSLFLGGAWTGPFWALVVVAGLAVPLLLEVVEARRHRPPLALTSVLVMAGGFALRWIVLAVGQQTL